MNLVSPPLSDVRVSSILMSKGSDSPFGDVGVPFILMSKVPGSPFSDVGVPFILMSKAPGSPFGAWTWNPTQAFECADYRTRTASVS